MNDAADAGRREPGPKDVAIDILYCGVCHSDLHTARGEWPGVQYPCVPGHEIVGRVTAVGKQATKFKPGELAAVGCMVDSCRVCEPSLAGSAIGGIAETQEMLDFCAAHGITADIEMIAMDQINVAYGRLLKSDVKYRFVIDMGTLGRAA
jgi:D-arabinose 1-dehydrogenase-like Zn-dependent alcohol dehydrogenase